MKRWTRIGTALGMIVALAGTMAVAQTDIKKDEKLKQPIVLDFKDTPISTALQVLFNGTGLNYVIDSNVTGTVKNLHLEVPFETALKSILRANEPPLVYKKQPGGDVYEISVKKPEPPPEQIAAAIDTTTPEVDTAQTEDTVIEKISLNFLAADVVKDLMEGKVTQNNNGNGFGGGGSFGGGGFGGGSGFGGGFGSSGSGFGSSSGSSGWGSSNGSSGSSGWGGSSSYRGF